MKTLVLGFALGLVALGAWAEPSSPLPERAVGRVERAYVRVADNVFVPFSVNEMRAADYAREAVWVDVRFRGEDGRAEPRSMLQLPQASAIPRIEVGDLVEVHLVHSAKALRVAPMPEVNRIVRLAAKSFSPQAMAFDRSDGSVSSVDGSLMATRHLAEGPVSRWRDF